jgi:hypothetical protein
MKKILIILLLIINVILKIKAQKNSIFYNLGTSVSYTSQGLMPFWFRSNQYGRIPIDKGCFSITGEIQKEYNKNKSGFFDWGVAAEGRANTGYKSNFILIEGYAKLSLSVFEIRAGRSKEIMGLCDTTLTSGSWSVSGNSIGIPKIQISIPEYYTIPILGRLFAFKGNFAHGWFGRLPLNKEDSIRHLDTYLHQKSLYGRFGKPGWKWHLYGGFNHQVIWGNEKAYWGDVFNLSIFKTYLYVLTGRGWSGSRMGDELGSIDLGFEVNFKKIRLLVYRQNIYDAGALYYLANIRDGLNGLCITSIKKINKVFYWDKILIELLYTKNQAGEPWSKHTPSGDEDYYNHYIYINGWSYNKIGIGNPLIAPTYFTKANLPTVQYQYFNDNRVIALHAGFEGGLKNWKLVIRATYSNNYGTYQNRDRFPLTKQFSAFLDAGRELKNNISIGFSGAFDVGELYYNSYGIMARISKSF